MSEYPSDEELTKVASWKIINQSDFIDLMEYIHGLWAYANDGYWIRNGDVFMISTAGWSGNEDIINALLNNSIFWLMYWHQSDRGGHHIFGTVHDCLDSELPDRTSKTSPDNNKPDETTIRVEGGFTVCQKCRSIVPHQMMTHLYYYCPNCGRKITNN